MVPRPRPRHLAFLAVVGVLAAVTWAPRTSPSATIGPAGDGEGTALAAQTEAAPDAEDLEVGEVAFPQGVRPVDRSPTSPQLPTDVVEPAPEPTTEPVPEVELEPVTATLPKIRIPQAPAGLIARVTDIDGVERAAEVRVSSIALDTPAGEEEVTIASVVPDQFRGLTPQVTADAVDVWRRIIDGDAAFTHESGQRLELELGEHVAATGGNDLRVGAYASNGAPPVADVIVSQSTAETLGVGGERTVLVATDGDPAAVAERLRDAFGVEPEVLEEPQQRRAFLQGADAENAFEPFTYVSYGDGMIEIDPEWVRRNITRASVPILQGEVVCHRLMIPQLRGALQEIEDLGLADLIDPSQYGGCWVPRHILFNPRRALSMHAWGIAVDLNVRGNEYGRRDFEMDPRIVEVFDRWGFNWGGRWSTPDAMHFELGAVLDSPEG